MSRQKPSQIVWELFVDPCDKTMLKYISRQEYETISKALIVPGNTAASISVKWKKLGTINRHSNSASKVQCKEETAGFL